MSHLDSEQPFSHQLLDMAARAVWLFRVELLLVGTVVAPSLYMWRSIGWPEATATAVVVALVALLVPASRQVVLRALYASRERRRFEIAISDLAVPLLQERPPYVDKVERVPAGTRLTLGLRRGTHLADFETAAPVIAAALGACEVRVVPDLADASVIRVTVARRNPLAGPPIAWPMVDAQRIDIWNPIPLGVDEDGQEVSVALVENNMLIGGQPGAGKSGAGQLLVASAALDPMTDLWLLDGKHLELAPWRPCARGFVGNDISGAIEMLRYLRSEMDLRYTQLLEGGARKVRRGDGFRLHLLFCDEAFLFTAHPDRKASAEFAEVLRDIVARGRAAGIVTVLSTQKPSTEVISSSIRDLIGYRLALRCTTRDASDTILGSGWASLGHSAADLDPSAPGSGLLLHESGIPSRIRTFWLDDATITEISRRAQLLRATFAGEGAAA